MGHMYLIRSVISKWVKVKAICNYVNDMQVCICKKLNDMQVCISLSDGEISLSYYFCHQKLKPFSCL